MLAHPLEIREVVVFPGGHARERGGDGDGDGGDGDGGDGDGGDVIVEVVVVVMWWWKWWWW